MNCCVCQSKPELNLKNICCCCLFSAFWLPWSSSQCKSMVIEGYWLVWQSWLDYKKRLKLDVFQLVNQLARWPSIFSKAWKWICFPELALQMWEILLYISFLLDSCNYIHWQFGSEYLRNRGKSVSVICENALKNCIVSIQEIYSYYQVM